MLSLCSDNLFHIAEYSGTSMVSLRMCSKGHDDAMNGCPISLVPYSKKGGSTSDLILRILGSIKMNKINKNLNQTKSNSKIYHSFINNSEINYSQQQQQQLIGFEPKWSITGIYLDSTFKLNSLQPMLKSLNHLNLSKLKQIKFGHKVENILNCIGEAYINNYLPFLEDIQHIKKGPSSLNDHNKSIGQLLSISNIITLKKISFVSYSQGSTYSAQISSYNADIINFSRLINLYWLEIYHHYHH